MTKTTDIAKDVLLYTQESRESPDDVAYMVKVGSHAYGTNTEDSDVDVRGVWVPELHKMLDGFKSPKVRENTVGELDIVVQPLNKFLKLCAGANPNILDWLFVPDKCRFHVDRTFERLILSRRDMFLTKQIYPRFKGYAESHFQKMERGVTPNLGEKRKKDVEAHGYSTKNAMHLIRLARMGCEALETGQYNIDRPDVEELLAIRRGEWSLEKVRIEGARLLLRLDKAVLTTKLPDGVSMDEVAKMVVEYVAGREPRKLVTVDTTQLDASQAFPLIKKMIARVRAGEDMADAAQLCGLRVTVAPFNAGDLIRIGPYAISDFKHGGFWLEHESGEGMQVHETNMVELIDEFYKRTF